MINTKSYAKEFTGNWKKFDCFAWSDKPEDADQRGIYYTCTRDSPLLEQSNASVIAKIMRPFLRGRDVTEERHTHWAVGWVDGYSIRVRRKGRLTRAFKRLVEIKNRLEEYPILDEDDYSRREYEATLENFDSVAYFLKQEYDLPKNWPEQVYSWFSLHDQSAIENRDDQGGYATEEQLIAAFEGLDFKRNKDAASRISASSDG